MNLNFAGVDLYRGFNLVASIVPSSTVKNVLQGVRLEVRDGKAELTSTDLEVLVRYTLPVKDCTGEGGIVLPAVRVNNILREWASNDEISIVVEGSNCTIKSKGGYFKVVGEDFGQFPEIHANDIKGFVEIDGEVFADMVGKVAHAVSTVRARSTLCGIFIRIDKDDITMAAADGNRLSTIKRKVSNPDGISMEGIVTVKCLTFLQRFTSECKGALKVGIGESQIRFKGEGGEVISQLIDGQYPKYEEVIPKENDKRIEINRDELLSAVRMASFMTSEGYRVVKFVYRKDKLILLSKAMDIGETELEIAANYDGPELEISFNPDYVLDVLKVSDNDIVTMELKDANDAAIFETGYEQLNVIMPVELK
ncbi:MAG: DNA polymerase III subunit beta [Candidatus Jettenia sp.]|nr:DNA polymerase III subunit beta [Candidatus Jettenia sp.]